MNNKANIFSTIILCLFTIKSVALGSEISDFAKAILYAEKGDYLKANQKLSPYNITESAFSSIIQARIKKDERLLKENFKIIPEIKSKVEDRINYEIARILFEKGDIEKSKEHILKIQDKNVSSVRFVLSNIQLLEGNPRDSLENLNKVKSEDIDDISYMKLSKSVWEETSAIYISPELRTSLFLGELPVRFEEEKYQKSWDLVSQFFGSIRSEILPYRNLSPFISYDFSGEFYTEIYGFTIHKISVGAEYRENIPLGGSYSLRIITYGPEIFGAGHQISPYIFPTKFLYLSITAEIQSYDIIPEREGFILSLSTNSDLSWKAGRVSFKNTPAIYVGKRFARSPKFSDIFLSLYLGNKMKLSDSFSINLSGLGSISMYPQEFEQRKMNLFLMITPYISLSQEFIRWDIVKPVIQINQSDSKNFSWQRILLGTSFEFIF